MAVTTAMGERRFGAAGDAVVIEECLTGPEVSFFVVCDGERAVPIGTAQDHKRIFDEDRGPNTGGMGAFAPSPLVDAALESRILSEIVEPVVAGMAADGHPFRGFLYVGLMLTADGPKVIEFNVRLGDPEAQVILPLIDEPLLPLLVAGAAGAIGQPVDPPCGRSPGRRCAGVARLSRLGRIRTPDRGDRPRGGDCRRERLPRRHRAPRPRVGHGRWARAHRGRPWRRLRRRDRARVFGVLPISFDGMQYRRDIGRKALVRSA
jgi:phosphoribosylamine--glycine ligase